MIPLAIFWTLFVVAIFMPLRFTVILYFVSLSFSALTVIPLNISGGITLLPSSVLAPVVLIKAISSASNAVIVWDALLNVQRFGLLTAFLLVSSIVTCTAPVLFQGIPVIGLNQGRSVSLAFSSSNLSQMLYLTTSCALAVAFYLILLSEPGRRSIAEGMLYGAAIAVCSGVLDITIGSSGAFESLRTASYSFILSAEIAGLRRVIGFGTEASSFGGLATSFLCLLYFMRPASIIGGKIANLAQFVLILALAVFSVLSTSSAALLTLGVFVIVALADFSARAMMGSSSGSGGALAVEGGSILLFGAAFATLLLLDQRSFSAIYDFVDTIILQKPASSSFEERGSWSIDSLRALGATFGFGVGIGSTRTSSWPVSILSSAGVIGAGLLLSFYLQKLLTMIPSGSENLRQFAIGGKRVILVTLASMGAASTTPDFGGVHALAFGALAGIPLLLSIAARDERNTGRSLRGSKPPWAQRIDRIASSSYVKR